MSVFPMKMQKIESRLVSSSMVQVEETNRRRWYIPESPVREMSAP